MSHPNKFGKDSLNVRAGYWKTVDQHLEQSHSVTYSKRVSFQFRSHTHPFADEFADELAQNEIAGLQTLDERLDPVEFFESVYGPTLGGLSGSAVASVGGDPPVDEVDLDYAAGAYAVYNWELFFHVPLSLGVQLSRNGLYPEAQKWFHYIFDPTEATPSDGPQRFWKFKPFKVNELEQLEETLSALSAESTDPEKAQKVIRGIEAWRSDPFRPHLVARTRPVAYMYATVMAYLDNLIAWGDSLFRLDTAESINEAMQPYISAANILGPKPQVVPSPGSKKAETYASLRDQIDAFGNASVRVEADLGVNFDLPPQASATAPQGAVIESIGRTLYFCLPRNEKFLSYWDTIADRLFKLRNSRNLAGVYRQLPLFAPPIDPALLALATAAGVDVSEMLSGQAVETSALRFSYWLQKASELAQKLESFGSQVLQAIEKKDNEKLAAIRAKNEKDLLVEVDRLRRYQWQEAIKAREGIEQTIDNAFARYRYYQRLLGEAASDIKKPEWSKLDPGWAVDEATGSFGEEPRIEGRSTDARIVQNAATQGRALIREEVVELIGARTAQDMTDAAAATDAVGAFLNLIPMFSADVKPIGLGAGIELGGMSLSSFLSGIAGITRAVASRVSFEAGQQGRMGGYVRREQEWAQQSNAAAGELNQLYKQYRGAEVRVAIAKKELDNHLVQKKQSEDVYEFLTNAQNANTGSGRKISDEKFYLWMKSEAQALHVRCHELAHDVAKKAEQAFQFELMEEEKSFVRNDYATGKEGLYAGERLALDLKAMEKAYAELNTRKLELTKHISLREWFPQQLFLLRGAAGSATIVLPEALFDLDCPDHSHRRIQSVAISIPCVTGPYASVHCGLALSGGTVRVGANAAARTYTAATSAIVTSTAQNDAGMFETNLRDERYLPFEGAGVIGSSWAIDLLGAPAAFDRSTISDVVLTIRYTARGGGAARTSESTKFLKESVSRAFSMRHEFSSEWSSFQRDARLGGGRATLKFTLEDGHHSYRVKDLPGRARVSLHAARASAGKVWLRRTGASPAPANEQVMGTDVVFDGTFARTGSFELELENADVDDLWLVFTGAQ